MTPERDRHPLAPRVSLAKHHRHHDPSCPPHLGTVRRGRESWSDINSSTGLRCSKPGHRGRSWGLYARGVSITGKVEEQGRDSMCMEGEEVAVVSTASARLLLPTAPMPCCVLGQHMACGSVLYPGSVALSQGSVWPKTH